MSNVKIIPYRSEFQSAVVALTVAAWSPVFAKTENEVPRFVYDAFYPQGWQARQTADVVLLLGDEPQNFWLALQDEELVGFIGIRIHPEDRMGEIHIMAVSPAHQRQGIGKALMDFADQQIRKAGMTMVMVETGGDTGHAPARHAYESSGFERWPVARYFKRL
ncbi:GNAT family N-acetyltransferase [Pelagibacterium sediminicola]|uniref:GNAT family N-acetyltransferase n=1 Tax=Pelagibacterium sediminicola TaxID=2248761 RepID=UPI000E31E045|nr:GNAT family N-acetyltransferase [Pelagibacterium sediminicola]